MAISQTNALERIARVLAGRSLSLNADGETGSAGGEVDSVWRDYLPDAEAVLRALREPDTKMASVGDAEGWTRMVRVALGEDIRAPGEVRSWAQPQDIYQKPLG